MPSPRRRAIALTAAAACVTTLVGCGGPFTITGRVVEGDHSHIAVVEPNDPRLSLPGVPGAVIEIEHRPGKLKAESIDRDLSDTDGEFALQIDRLFAGTIPYDVAVHADRAGQRRATHFFDLPTNDSQRILVVLAPDPAASETAQAP